MTILILSNKNDAHINFVLPELQNRNLNCLIVNTDEYPKSFSLESRINNYSHSNSLNGMDIDKIHSVWYRRPLKPSSENQNHLYKKYIDDETEGFANYFFNSLRDRIWVSIPSNIELARNKILQLEYAKEIGFSVPDTIITTDLESFNSFYEKNNHKAIIKSIKGHWYDNFCGEDYLFFTSLLEDSKLPTEESLRISPCMFQEYIEKEFELRSTVIGNRVFTAAIYSQENETSKIDWRLGTDKIRHEAFNLPKETENQLKGINKRMGLNFGAYDLIVTPNDELVFLELNPNGQWGWVQERTGLKIKEALVDFLQNGTN